MNHFDSVGDTALYHACDKGNEGIVAVLLTHPHLKCLDFGYKHYPLQVSVQHGYTRIVESLLEAGADVNKVTLRLCQQNFF